MSREHRPGIGFAAAARTWAAERPDAAAVVADGRIVTWVELAGLAAAVAAVVTGAGGGGVRVAVAPPTGALGVVALHGVALAGAQAVLVHPRWTDAEVTDLLLTTAPALILHAGDRKLPASITAIDLRDLAPRPMEAAAPSDLAEMIVPTSGTTARPRLARLPLDRLVASAVAWSAVLPDATAWLLSLGLAHVAGLGIVVRAAMAGVPVVVTPPPVSLAVALGFRGADGSEAASPAGAAGVSHASLVAAQLARVLDATGDAPPPSALRAVLLGGGPIPVSLVTRALAARWPIWPSYGATETASGIAAASPAQARIAPWSAGVALPGVSLRIADAASPAAPSDSAPPTLEPGPVGELQVRGPMLFAGYLDDPGASPARITPDGWLRTGDLAAIGADGRLRILDRIDDLIISGGENVAPAEVESVLAAVPGVREVAVVGAPDAEWGTVPVAVVAPVVGADPTDADLRTAVDARLATFRRPRRILRIAALPRGGAEKVLRRSLRGPVAAALAVPLPSTSQRGPDLELRTVLADDGQPLLVRAAPRAHGDTRPTVLILHATLSSSAQLLRLAIELTPDARVLLLDRRGSGGSPMVSPSPVTIARHVADAATVLAANGELAAYVVGHSFGGVVALELAARHPELVRGVVAWEPPYIPLAPLPDREQLARVAHLVGRAHASRGRAAAARIFMGTVSPGAWERLRPAQQELLGDEGDGVLADAAMPDLDPDGLARIGAPVILGTGTASEPFYAPIAEAIRERVPGARVEHLSGLRHFAPIVNAGPVADLVRPLLATDPSADPAPMSIAQEPSP